MPDTELRPAKFNDRLIAFVLDTFPFVAGNAATLYVAVVQKHLLPDSVETIKRVGAIWLGLLLLYEILGNATGATIGKRMMGLRIVRKDGEPIGFFRGFVRALGYGLSMPFCNWGFLVALIHPESRAFHDLISGSVVIEAQPRSGAESTLFFVAAVIMLTAMYGGSIYLYQIAPTPKDRLAVEKAQDGLLVMAQIEEAYRASGDRYTSNLADLASASGDPDSFRSSMSQIFDPNKFGLQAGNKAYRITAYALDRRHTQVAVEGPPAQLVK
jgi:uncharacterized RDD family membrane protein YckC